MLMRRWERARQGDGQLVLIVGEPGLGKSRLIEEFHARLGDTPHTWVEWSCSQLLQNTPLHPIAEWGRQRFGGADVPAERRLADLENSLAQVKLDPAENASLLAPLLDIPLPPGRAPALAPEELRRRQLAALTNWVMAGAKVQPVVLAFEDLHWADPTTLDVLRGIAERGALAPLLIVATARPEFRPPWGMRSHHGTISLAPLDRAQVRDMVAELSARHALPSDVVEDVAARTGGVPLFVEEVTRLLLEGGEQGGIQTIPPTLQQSLMARLDRLGPAREVAQIGSVIGRGFSYALLRNVAGMEDAPLQAALERLAEADILLVQGMPPESDYRFKHALIQDAAYENLAKKPAPGIASPRCRDFAGSFRRCRFGGAGAAGASFYPGGPNRSGVRMVGQSGTAVAGALCASRSRRPVHAGPRPDRGLAGHAGAASRADKASGRAHNPARPRQGFTAPETKAAAEQARLLIEQAEALGEPPEDPLLLFSVLYSFWIASTLATDRELTRELAEQLVAMAEKQGAIVPLMIGHRAMGISLLSTGHIWERRAHFDRSIALYEPAEHRPLATRFGQDARVAALSFRSVTLWLLGHPDAALADTKHALMDAREMGQAATLMYALVYASMCHILRGSYVEANAQLEEVIALAEEKNAFVWKTLGPC